jgi:hypothetical protein
MSASQFVGKRVQILVSDPWEFGTECGVGPFAAVITAAKPDVLLLTLEVPIEYQGARLKTVVARPHFVSGEIVSLTSEGHLDANFAILRVSVATLSEVTDDAETGMVSAIGSLESS